MALYVSACASATRDKPTAAPAAPATAATPAQPQATLSSIPPSSLEMSNLPPGSLPLPSADNPAPHIALLLPLKSAAFARAAEAVQQGFQAAAGKVQQGLPVRVYASADDSRDVITLYRQALANGAVAVAGPLTRDGVAVLAGYPDIAVPTLALNVTETRSSAGKLYFYGLTADTEARQIAQLAFKAKYHDATIVMTGSPLSRRLATAFAAEWKALGGNITAEVLYNNDPTPLSDLPVAPWPPGMSPPVAASAVGADGEPTAPKRPLPPPVAPSNVAFLAADSATARLIRPYFNPSLPVYGTSQLFNGNGDTLTNFDLNDIRFVDMPWMVQPEHSAVMLYPHANPPLEADMERLYALGVDAFRLLQAMRLNTHRNSQLEGVTGRIRLKEANTFQRESVPALFRLGRGLTPEALNAINAAKAAEKAAERAAELAARKAAESTASKTAK